MKLKYVLNAYFSLDGEGRICIKQYSVLDQRNEYILLTLDQFKLMYEWVTSNESAICAEWNNGIEVEDDSEA